MGIRRHWVPILKSKISIVKSLVQPFTGEIILHFLKVGNPLEDSNCANTIRCVEPLAMVDPQPLIGLKFLVQLWVCLLQGMVGKIIVLLFLTTILCSFSI